MQNRTRSLLIPLLLLLLTSLTAVERAQAQTTNQPELPRLWLDTTYTPPAGNVIEVAAGGNLQAALNGANPGDTLVLEAGATFIGNFTLPHKSGANQSSNAWIVIRSSAAASLPSQGNRVDPGHAALMPKLLSPNADPAVRTLAGAHHFRFLGIEFGLTPNVTLNYGLVAFGSDAQTSLAQAPSDLVLDRCYVRGNPAGNIARGVALNCARGAVIDSYIAEIHGVGFDTQAIAGWNGPGPFKIVNNYLEGAGENVMFGGADPKIANLVPSDIEFRRNRLSKPLSWNFREPSYAGIRWSVKNIFELKNAQRVLVDGNLFEHNWVDGQNGTAILFTPRNQDGAAPWSRVQDVTFTNNLVRHTAAGVNLLGYDYNHTSQQVQRVLIENNLFVDVGNPRWGGGGVLFYLLDATADVRINHNTALQSGNVISADGQAHTRFAYTNNLTPHNSYGVIGSGYGPGNPTLNAYFPGREFAKNLLAGGAASIYPAGNFFPATLDAVGFVDRGGGDYRLAAGSPYKNAGTDGEDVGADIDAIEAAIAGAPPVPNQPPTVTLAASATSGTFPLTVTFTSNATDTDGQVVAYDWDFGEDDSAAAPTSSASGAATASYTYETTGTFVIAVTVTDNDGATATATVSVRVTKPPPQFPHPGDLADVVLYAAESTAVKGNWQVIADQTAAGGAALYNADRGAAKINTAAAEPKHYFEMTFYAEAGVAYRLWTRGRAQNDSPYNDSFFVQFSDSVDATRQPSYRIGTSAATVVNLEEALHYGLRGWGWQDNGWGLGVLGEPIYFETTGLHTVRIQPREDGVILDQLVLSPLKYLLMSPGALQNDGQILPKSNGQ